MEFLQRPDTSDGYTVNEVYRHRLYERHLSIQPSDCWLDIGGHIGCFTVKAAELGARVIAYEPDPENFSMLVYNVKQAGLLDRVSLNQTAVVGTSDEQREFYLNLGMGRATHSLIPKRGRSIIMVKADHINTILEAHPINKIKLDCEGAEVEILYACDFARFNVDGLAMEFHFDHLRDKTHEKYFAMIEFLKERFNTVKYNLNPASKNRTAMVHATNLIGDLK